MIYQSTLTISLIEVFGYKGPIKKQKEQILNLIGKYAIHIAHFSNDEYTNFTGHLRRARNNNSSLPSSTPDLSSYYPEITKAQLKSRPKHVLIMPDDLKKLWLVVNTENGNRIREYVIALEKLIKLYMAYQSEYKSKQILLKDKKLDELIVKVDTQSKQMEELLGINTEMKETLDDMYGRLVDSNEERAPRTKI